MERFRSAPSRRQECLHEYKTRRRSHAAVGAQPPFGRFFGMTFTHVSPDRVVSELVVREELTNRNGVLHGGAVMGLADNLGGTASFLNLPAGATPSTVDSKTNFFTPCAP